MTARRANRWPLELLAPEDLCGSTRRHGMDLGSRPLPEASS